MTNPKLIRITTVPVSLAGLIRGQHRYMTQQGFEVVGVSSSGKALDEVSKSEGVRTEVVEMTRILSPVKDLKSLWQFYRFCRKEKPTIVHSHTPKAGIVGMMGAWLARVPIRLHTVAGMPLMEATGAKRKLLDLVEKMTYGFATKVYPNSQGLYDFIVEGNYAKPKKLHVIANGSSNGIDTSFFSLNTVSEETKQQLRQELGIKDNDFLFVFVGRMVGDKGLNELIAAFPTIHEKNPNAHLLLVGNFERELDPLLSQTEEVISNHPNIHAVGFKSNVKDYFAISDALVFPSYREGFPNVVMQAGAMGLPSIATDINGCNEIIEEGTNGIIIPPKDVIALKNAMLEMIENKELYNHLKSNAREMITSRYEQRIVWEALLEEYKRLIDGVTNFAGTKN
jgi:glycosyltransferase involved in cell wall biosynthesis